MCCVPGHHAVPWKVSGELCCEACATGTYEADGVCDPCLAGVWAPTRSSSVLACTCNVLSNDTCVAA